MAGKFNEVRPDDILDEHWEFMLRCWDRDLERCRPTAKESVQFLDNSYKKLYGDNLQGGHRKRRRSDSFIEEHSETVVPSTITPS